MARKNWLIIYWEAICRRRWRTWLHLSSRIKKSLWKDSRISFKRWIEQPTMKSTRKSQREVKTVVQACTTPTSGSASQAKSGPTSVSSNALSATRRARRLVRSTPRRTFQRTVSAPCMSITTFVPSFTSLSMKNDSRLIGSNLLRTKEKADSLSSSKTNRVGRARMQRVWENSAARKTSSVETHNQQQTRKLKRQRTRMPSRCWPLTT